MNIPKLRRLDGRGFSHHLLMPILAVVAVAVIGGITLRLIHAATLTVNLYQGNCAQKVELTQANAGSANRTCAQQVQDLVDIYQYAATGHFAIPGNGETFSYEGKMTMVIMNGSYNGATQFAVNTLAGSPSLTNAAVSGSTVNNGTWQNFCSTVAGKLGTAAFTGHSTYDFSPNKNKASGYYIGSSGKTIFGSVCGTERGKSFSTAASGTGTSSTGTPCTSYTVATSKNPTPKGSPCVYYLQTILNGAWESNPYSYTSVAKAYDKYYKVADNPMGGVNANENNYNQLTSVRIMAFQAVTAYNGTPLSVTGTTDGMTWDALCALAHTYGSGNSYVQAAKTVAAASDSGCAKVTGTISSAPHQTTPPPLSCTGGASLNAAKTACACPSGQSYSGGGCVKPDNGGGKKTALGPNCAAIGAVASGGGCICPTGQQDISGKCGTQASTFSCTTSGSSTGSAGVNIVCKWTSNNPAADASYSFSLPGGYTSGWGPNSPACKQNVVPLVAAFTQDVQNSTYPASAGYASTLGNIISYLEGTTGYPNCF